MSKQADVYDALVAKLGVIFPTHSRLPNPYSREENANVLLEKAWGLVVGSAINTERKLSKTKSYEREFVVVLTRQASTTTHDVTLADTLIKLLLDDQNSLLLAIEDDPQISSTVSDAVVPGDTGIEFDDESRYYFLETALTTEFFQSS